MIRKLASLDCVLMLAAAPTAHASLLGQTADCDMQPNGSFWSCSPASNTVTDPGIEFQLNLVGNPFFSIDIGASSVLLTLISGGGLGMGAGEVLTLSGLDGILGASLNFSQSAGFDASDISFTANSLTLLLNNSSWSPGQQALIDLTVARVPEPASLALLGLGLVAVALSRRRR